MVEFAPREVAAWVRGVWDPAPPSGTLRGAVQDTRMPCEQRIYVALRGERHDGHAFVEEAFRKGAAAALVDDRRCRCGSARPVLRVRDVRQALRDMASAWRDRVDPEIVAVTGSTGKTTVKELLAAMLRPSRATASTPGNWNNEIGMPLSVLGMEPQTRAGVFEVGTNHPGEIRSLCEVLRPTRAILTNVGAVHVEFFGDVPAVAEEKGAVLDRLPEWGTAVLDADGVFFEGFRRRAPAPVVSVSMRGESRADYVCLRRAPAGTALLKEWASGDELEFRPPVPGEFGVRNTLLAVAMARVLDASWSDIAAAIAGFSPPAMRWQRTRCGQWTVINDAYNANPPSMQAALKALGECEHPPTTWLILGEMRELGRQAESSHRQLGRQVAAEAWAGMIGVGGAGEWIVSEAEQAGMDPGRTASCPDVETAARAVRERVRPGSTIFLKASRGVGLERMLDLLGPG